MIQEMIHQELNAEGRTLQEQAVSLVVTDQTSFERAGLFLRTLKEYLKRVAEVFDPLVKKAHETWKEALAQKQKLEAPALGAERALKSTMAAWDQVQRQLAREAEETARREQQRLSDDAKLDAAVEAEARGDGQAATRILEAPMPPTPIIVPAAITPPPPSAEGVSFRTNYRADVVDLKALIMAVASGQAAVAYLLANQPALNQAARAMKEELRIPGVRVVVERVAAVRA